MKTGKKHSEHEEGHKQANHSSHNSKSVSWHSGPGKGYLFISIAIMVVMLGVIVYLLSSSSGPATPSTGQPFSGEKVTVEFYVMSQCPYGTQVEDAIYPVLQRMGEAVDYQVDYILRETSPGQFQSLHGPKEVAGNKVQLCVKKYYPAKFADFLSCQNKDASNVDTNWNSCADSLSLDASKIGVCLNGEEGNTLLRESMQKANARNAQGSPTMFINNVAYNGGRTTADFQKAICRYSKHPACANMPACETNADCVGEPGKEGTCENPGKAEAKCTYKDPVPVELIVLTDDKCTSCDTSRIVQVSQQLFLGVKPRVVDVDSAEGKELVASNGVELLPAYIFGSSVVQTASWSTVEGLPSAFDAQADGSFKLKDEVTGATYFVSEEARNAFYANIGVTKGDNKPQIDFFVMSYCPFGNQAEEGIAPVYELLKDKADFKPHYVIYSNYGGGGEDYCLPGGTLCSMHGRQELNQNIREACVLKYDGVGKWFDFALEMNAKCSAQNADSCWEAAAKGLSLDTARIKTCEKNEGEALMAADKELGDKLGVGGSPSVFIDGDSYNGGRTPEAYKQSLCAAFDNVPAECSTKLAGDVAPTANTAAGCGV